MAFDTRTHLLLPRFSHPENDRIAHPLQIGRKENELPVEK